ncbi:MAG: ribosome maturation factor RimM [Chryseolinea sp.]
MQVDACFKIGFIQKTHGLKGEVTAVLDTNAPGDLRDLKTLFLGDENRVVPYFITAISQNGTKALLKLEDIDSIDDARLLVKKSAYLEKSIRPKKGRGEFYDDEIVGFTVNDAGEGHLGEIIEIIQAGPNKLLTVSYGEKEILIPIAGPFIISVNKTKKIVSVNLPDGFLDI